MQAIYTNHFVRALNLNNLLAPFYLSIPAYFCVISSYLVQQNFISTDCRFAYKSFCILTVTDTPGIEIVLQTIQL